MKSATNARKLISGLLSSRDGVRVFGAGAAKTGTHSFGEMFSDRVRSAHEQDCAKLISLHLDSVDSGDRRALRRFLRWRDATRKLKIDASQVNVYLIDDLLELWPDSRFVLTVRPPMTWLRSIVDDSLRRDTGQIWKRFREYRFATPGPLPPEEKALSNRGLFSLSGYLGYWADSITRVTDRVPAEQVLVLSTDSLHERSAEIADFCGIADPNPWMVRQEIRGWAD